MSEDLHIKIVYDIDDSKLTQSLSKVQSNTTKSLAGGSGSGTPQTMIDRSLVQAGKLQDRINLLRDSYSKLANQPGQERNLAKISNELATQYGHYKNMAKTSTDYLSLLEKEVSLRKQAAQLTNQANRNDNLYSAHSDRQFAMLQQLAGQAPGGNILSRFLGGARSSALANMAEGGSGSMLSGGALAGGAAAAGVAAAAAGIAIVTSKLGEMASRAQELAQSASSASSSLGQLRSQTERNKIQGDANAVSSGVGIASVQQWATQTINSIVGGFWDGLTGKTQQSKQADIQKAISGGLGGDAGEQWRRIKEAGQDTQLDLARQRQSLDIQQQRQTRDFQLDYRQFEIETANQKFDLQKQAQRNEQDYTLAKQQYDENFAGQLAKKQFDLSQHYAQQSFINQMQDRAYDYGVSRQRAQTDYNISRSDKAYDFGVSRSRNQTEFNISQSRNTQDYQENLMKAALGGASGQDYLFMAMDFRKAQQRQKEDFTRQQQYAQADYNVSASRDARGFALSQQRAGQDFSVANQRDTRNFTLSQQQAMSERELQIEAMLYSRKYEGIQLELQHNRNLQDASIALQRFTQATGFQQQRFSNQAGDISVDQALANRDYNINAYRSLRGQSYNEQDFAGQLRKDNPLAAYGQSLTDPAFAAALARNAQATGQLPLGQQINNTLGLNQGEHTPGAGILAGLGNVDLGNIIGQAIVQAIPGLSLIGAGFNLFGGGGSQGGGSVSFNPVHNVTFPTTGAASQNDLQQQYQQYLRDLQALDSKYASAINATTGSNNVFVGF